MTDDLSTTPPADGIRRSIPAGKQEGTAPAAAQVGQSVVPGGVGLSDQEFALFQKLIYREAGIHLPDSKKPLVLRRLGGRVRELNLKSFIAYYRMLKGEGGEKERVCMLDRITTNETHFFREPRQFAYLEEELVPEWKRAADAKERPRQVRVWSAACSTGEEPYSLAMVLLHHLPPGAGWQIDILATDISTRALATAQAAVWPIEKIREIPEGYLKEFMLRGKRSQLGRIKAGRLLRSVVRFQRLNLHDESYSVGGPFDLILCRNVLIYFDPKSKVAALQRLLQHLSPDGYLFVGHAESLSNLSQQVRLVAPTIYRPDMARRRDAGPLPGEDAPTARLRSQRRRLPTRGDAPIQSEHARLRKAPDR